MNQRTLPNSDDQPLISLDNLVAVASISTDREIRWKQGKIQGI